MNVLLLLAGVADPKWPMPPVVNAPALAVHRAAHPLLSPFDEAALELALKLRDAEPTLHIGALLSVTSATDPLLRQVAGFRLDEVAGFSLDRWPAWRGPALARALAARLRSSAQPPDLVLIGREFGDLDDGSLPATLAQALELPFVNLAIGLSASEPGLMVLRQHGTGLEHLALALPAVAAVGNDARNRLRHPLLKNVMAARKMHFEMLNLAESSTADPVRLCGLTAASSPPRAATCRMLAGDAAAQARELADLLRSTEPAA